MSYLGSLNASHKDDDYLLSSSSALNKSSISTSSTSNTNSKAVLAALRALQDKIRRLETERSQALDDCQALRHQLKSLEIEAEHAKQKDNLISQRQLSEARVSYDKLQHDKTELEVRLSKLEENHHHAQVHADELLSTIRSLEEEKHHNLSRIKELEAQNLQIEQQIGTAQDYEKDLAQKLTTESRTHENEISSLTTRIKSLQHDVDRVHAEKSLHAAKVKELDKLVTQLLGVNESLVEQLSGKLPKGGNKIMMDNPMMMTSKKSSSSSRKKSTSSTASSSASYVPRVALATTAANEANKVKKASTKRMIPIKSDDVENLQKLHKMYSDIASSILTKSDHHHIQPSSGKVDNNMISDHHKSSRRSSSASRSRTPTRLSKKQGSSSSSMTRPSLTSQDVFGVDLRDHHHHIPSSASSKPLIVSIPVTSNHNRSGMVDNSMMSTSSSAHHHNNTLSSSFRAPMININHHDDLSSTINILEEEFNDLNRQYRQLLGAVQSSDVGDDDRAEQLISIIQKLHKKGEQLRTVRSPVK